MNELVGQSVEAIGLVNRKDLNGKRGTVISYDAERERCAVKFYSDDASDGQPVLLKPANLRVIELPPEIKPDAAPAMPSWVDEHFAEHQQQLAELRATLPPEDDNESRYATESEHDSDFDEQPYMPKSPTNVLDANARSHGTLYEMTDRGSPTPPPGDFLAEPPVTAVKPNIRAQLEAMSVDSSAFTAAAGVRT